MSDTPRSTTRPRNRLDRETWVPIGVALTVAATLLAFVVGARSFLDDKFQDVMDKVQDGTEQIQELDRRIEKLEDRGLDRWTHTDQTMWVLTFQRDNPTIAVPPAVRGQPLRPPPSIRKD